MLQDGYYYVLYPIRSLNSGHRLVLGFKASLANVVEKLKVFFNPNPALDLNCHQTQYIFKRLLFSCSKLIGAFNMQYTYIIFNSSIYYKTQNTTNVNVIYSLGYLREFVLNTEMFKKVQK